MKLLLDTHIFVWFIENDPKLSSSIREHIRSPDNDVYLSVVSFWEAIIKQQIGKLSISERVETFFPSQRQQHFITSLGVDEATVVRLAQLPLLHRDPFDRMLICQAQEHGLTVVTEDGAFSGYRVKLL